MKGIEEKEARIVKAFGELATSYLNRARTQKKKEEIVQAMNRAVKEFSKEGRKILNLSRCPPGWVRCDDDSCVPDPDLC